MASPWSPASGNDGIKVTQGQAPQAYPEVITVGGYQDTDGVPGGLGRVVVTALEMQMTSGRRGATGAHRSRLMAVADCEQVIANDGTIEWDAGTSLCGPAVAGAAVRLAARLPSMDPAVIKANLVKTATHQNLRLRPTRIRSARHGRALRLWHEPSTFGRLKLDPDPRESRWRPDRNPGWPAPNYINLNR